jgi:redox-sensitive bicupin YhaK (pirin superfamily)
MTQIRKLRLIITGTPQVDGAGVKLLRVLGLADVEDIDPFLMLDAFDSTNPADYVKGFPWHPHRGIETVTYLIEGEIEHGDSLGNTGCIRSGGCQWMTAGSGIIHQELPKASNRMLGLQLWLNLPRKDKFAPPAYRDIPAASIPKVEEPGIRVAVISGSYGEATGPTQGEHIHARILDAALEPDAAWSLAVDPLATVVLYLIEGSAFLEGTLVEHRRALVLGEGDTVAIRAGAQGLRMLLLEGRPLKEPIAWGGPVVMNTREELRQAFAEIEDGTFIR